MKITRIKPAVKTTGRFNIFVDETYQFSLDESQLLTAKLRVGQTITDDELAQLKKESDVGKKYWRALDLIMRRPRSEKELRDYAFRKKWEEDDFKIVRQRLVEKGYLDDDKFAHFWVRNRALGKPISRRKLVNELRQKGVAPGSIEAALMSDDAPNEQGALRAMVAKKRVRYDDDQKLIAYLARQGFSYSDIKTVLDE